jgi:hypothetical protein
MVDYGTNTRFKQRRRTLEDHHSSEPTDVGLYSESDLFFEYIRVRQDVRLSQAVDGVWRRQVVDMRQISFVTR